MKKLYFMAIALVIPGIFSSIITHAMDDDFERAQKNEARHRAKLNLKVAINKGNKKAVEERINMALKRGVNLKKMDTEVSSLDNTYITEHVSLLTAAAQQGHGDIVKLLINQGMDIDKAEYDGSTPLMRAAANGHLGAVKALVEAGANLNLVDTKRKTALDYAVNKKHEDVANYLLDHGAGR